MEIRRTAAPRSPSSGAPFVLPFRTDRATYVYDVNTNRILRVSAEVHTKLAEIQDRGWPEDPEVAAAADPALAAILRLRAKGLLLGKGPRPIAVPDHRACLTKNISTELSQLTLEITENCNLRCRYCVYGAGYAGQREHGFRPMTEETAFKALAYFYAHNGRAATISVGFYGGEPLSAFDMIRRVTGKALEYARGPETHLHMTTNGTLLTPERFEFLVKNNFALLVSLDGAGPVHDRNRRNVAGRGTHDLILANLGRLQAFDPTFYENNVMFSCVRTPAVSLSELAEFFATHPLTRRQRVQITGVSEGAPELMRTLEAEVEDWDRLRNDHDSMTVEYLKRLFSRRVKGAKWRFLESVCGSAFTRLQRRELCDGPGSPAWINGMCVPAWRKLFVAADGQMYTCERVGRSRPIGDVDTGVDLDRVFEYLAKHHAFTDRHCTGCWAIRLCGACQSTIGGPDGIDPERVRLHCAQERSQLAESLDLYTRLLEEDPHALDYIESISIS